MEKKELFKWQPNYSMQVASIDVQHKKWIGIMNKLYQVFASSKNRVDILKILQEMKTYTLFHFRMEEKYFDQFKFEEAEKHKQLHAEFVATLNKFKKDYENDSTALTYEMMLFVQNWLSNHILVEDKKYSKLFNEHGL